MDTTTEAATAPTPESGGTPPATETPAEATPTTATSPGKNVVNSLKDADKFIKAPYVVGEL